MMSPGFEHSEVMDIMEGSMKNIMKKDEQHEEQMEKPRFLAMHLASHVLLRGALETIMVPAACEPFRCHG